MCNVQFCSGTSVPKGVLNCVCLLSNKMRIGILLVLKFQFVARLSALPEKDKLQFLYYHTMGNFARKSRGAMHPGGKYCVYQLSIRWNSSM